MIQPESSMPLSLLCAMVIATSVQPHGELHEKIAALTREIAAEPTAVRYARRGELQRQHRDFERAIADFDQALRMDPSSFGVLVLRARASLDSNCPERARDDLDAFLARQPEHVEARLLSAQTYEALGQPRAAALDYDRALQGYDRVEPIWLVRQARAWAAVSDRGLERGLLVLDAAGQRMGHPLTLRQCAIDLCVERGQTQEALDRIDRLITESPRPDLWWLRRATVLDDATRPAEALLALTEARHAHDALHPRLRRSAAGRRVSRDIDDLAQRIGAAQAKGEHRL
ncbi:MAG: tetratricopeptide repeat protein [Planctomycetes bacterium]|nr:tetratricopeptide repeat protein [Planctomycetota bacterium]